MRFVEHELSRAIRFFRVESREGKSEHGPRIARAFEDRYEFMQGPRTVEEYDTTKGALFRRGHFQGKAIESLQLYNNGILVEGRVDTALLDALIDDVIQWAQAERGLLILPNENATSITKAFLSRLVVEFAPTSDSAFIALHEVSREVVMAVTEAGIPAAPVGFTGISVGPDPASGQTWAFQFERRVNEQFNSNKFFSAAPLTTAAHFGLLERIARISSGQPTA